ncbi:MAG: hypothetical protein V1912_07855 [bacterium]
MRLAIGLAFVVAAGIALAGWGFAGPATATPGMSCNPEPGHGSPGCHVGATTTTKAPTATTKAPTATTAKPTPTTAGASTATTNAGTSTTGATTSSVPTTSSTPSTPTTSSVSTASSVPSAGSALPSDPTAPLFFLDQNNCLDCHGDPSLTKKRADGTSVSLFVDAEVLPGSVHRYQDCTTCHSSNPHEVQTPLTKLSLAEKCGTCHDHQYGQYMSSVHGVPQPSGNSDPASCTDCHSATSNPHNVARVADPSASTYPKNIADTCAKCHDDPQLMGKYGIVEKVYDSYMRSFHGKTMELSSDKVAIEQLSTATCVNCHGAHNIQLVADPNSPVAGMDNLAKTCEQCHPGAGPQFASGFLGHKEADSRSNPQVFWGERFFFIFTRVVLAGGVFLVAMPVGRMVVDRLRGKDGSPENEDGPPENEDGPPENEDGTSDEDGPPEKEE